jgi:hypothetical protein
MAEMQRLTIAGGADFWRALFEDTARISCELTGELSLRQARFRGLTELAITGPGATAIHFDDVLCEGQIDARLAASMILIHRSRLDRGGRIIIERGVLSALEARLERPTLVAAAAESRADPPWLRSVSGSDLSGTTLSGLDLRQTRFARAHGLSGLRIDGRLLLERRHYGLLRSRRYRIADEDDARRGSAAVSDGETPAPSFEEVAALYRDLRASREGRKDEPGAAGFYYGEMEMRRLAAAPFSAERTVLELYRAISGYGMHASRSLAALAALVFAATALFHEALVDDPPGWWATLLFSLRSTVSFVREPQLEGMTLAGEFVQLGLRFTGPVLLALTVLAVRAQVRR